MRFALIAILMLTAIGFLIFYPDETTSETPDETPAPVATTPPPTQTPTPTPEIRKYTITDEDLPQPPLQGLTFRFLSPGEGDPGPGKMRAKYLALSKSIWFGVAEGNMWLYGLPSPEGLIFFPQSIQQFIQNYLGIGEHTQYTKEDSRYWITDLPPWLDLAKYDEDVTEIPYFISVETTDGKATISYMLR